jgi:putative lipase involved disintegration of autophagic bodies
MMMFFCNKIANNKLFAICCKKTSSWFAPILHGNDTTYYCLFSLLRKFVDGSGYFSERDKSLLRKGDVM